MAKKKSARNRRTVEAKWQRIWGDFHKVLNSVEDRRKCDSCRKSGIMDWDEQQLAIENLANFHLDIVGVIVTTTTRKKLVESLVEEICSEMTEVG